MPWRRPAPGTAAPSGRARTSPTRSVSSASGTSCRPRRVVPSRRSARADLPGSEAADLAEQALPLLGLGVALVVLADVDRLDQVLRPHRVGEVPEAVLVRRLAHGDRVRQGVRAALVLCPPG